MTTRRASLQDYNSSSDIETLSSCSSTNEDLNVFDPNDTRDNFSQFLLKKDNELAFQEIFNPNFLNTSKTRKKITYKAMIAISTFSLFFAFISLISLGAGSLGYFGFSKLVQPKFLKITLTAIPLFFSSFFFTFSLPAIALTYKFCLYHKRQKIINKKQYNTAEKAKVLGCFFLFMVTTIFLSIGVSLPPTIGLTFGFFKYMNEARKVMKIGLILAGTTAISSSIPAITIASA